MHHPHIVLTTVYILLYSHCIRRKKYIATADTRRRKSIRCGGMVTRTWDSHSMVEEVYGLSGIE